MFSAAGADPVAHRLDLSRHSDRVRADLALRLLEVTTSAGRPRPEGVPTAARLPVLDPDL